MAPRKIKKKDDDFGTRAEVKIFYLNELLTLGVKESPHSLRKRSQQIMIVLRSRFTK